MRTRCCPAWAPSGDAGHGVLDARRMAAPAAGSIRSAQPADSCWQHLRMFCWVDWAAAGKLHIAFWPISGTSGWPSSCTERPAAALPATYIAAQLLCGNAEAVVWRRALASKLVPLAVARVFFRKHSRPARAAC